VGVLIRQVRDENGRRRVRQHVLADASSSRTGRERNIAIQYDPNVQRVASKVGVSRRQVARRGDDMAP